MNAVVSVGAASSRLRSPGQVVLVMESWSEVRPSLSTVSAYSGLIDRNGTEQRGNVQRLLPVLDSRYRM